MSAKRFYLIEQVTPCDAAERDAVRRGFKVFAVRTRKVKHQPVVWRTCARNANEVEGEIEYRHVRCLEEA